MNLTKTEARREVYRNSFVRPMESCGHRGCQEHRTNGARVINVLAGGSGLSLELADVDALIDRATHIYWEHHVAGHDLVIVDDLSQVWAVLARRPEPAMSTTDDGDSQ